MKVPLCEVDVSFHKPDWVLPMSVLLTEAELFYTTPEVESEKESWKGNFSAPM
jgi:hypothetical protein